SFCICMLELANCAPPNCSNVKRAMFKTATEGLGKDLGLADPSKWSPLFKDFLSKAGTINPDERPTAQMLLEHDFLRCAVDISEMEIKLRKIFLTDQLKEVGTMLT